MEKYIIKFLLPEESLYYQPDHIEIFGTESLMIASIAKKIAGSMRCDLMYRNVEVSKVSAYEEMIHNVLYLIIATISFECAELSPAYKMQLIKKIHEDASNMKSSLCRLPFTIYFPSN